MKYIWMYVPGQAVQLFLQASQLGLPGLLPQSSSFWTWPWWGNSTTQGESGTDSCTQELIALHNDLSIISFPQYAQDQCQRLHQLTRDIHPSITNPIHHPDSHPSPPSILPLLGWGHKLHSKIHQSSFHRNFTIHFHLGKH